MPLRSPARNTTPNPPAENTRRALRESEGQRSRQRPAKYRPRRAQSLTRQKSPRRSVRNRIFGVVAMAAVGLMAVTTSIPALAVNSATSAHTLDTTSSISQTTQTIEVGTVTTSAAIERDGYTVAEVPKIVPATSGKSTAVRGGTDSGQLSNQGWVLPVAGVISDPYGPRPNRPVAGVGDFHGGTDIAALCGTPVSAATGGTVTFAGSNGTSTGSRPDMRTTARFALTSDKTLPRARSSPRSETRGHPVDATFTSKSASTTRRLTRSHS